MSWSEDWSEIAPPPPPTPLPHSPRPPQMDPLCQNGHPSPSPIIHFAKKNLPLENLQNPTLQIQLRWSCHQNIISNFQRWAWVGCLHFISWAHHMRRVCIRGVHISMGKFQSGFLKKHIIFLHFASWLQKYKSWAFWPREMRVLGTFSFNGNFNGKMTKKNEMAKNHFSGVRNGSQSV